MRARSNKKALTTTEAQEPEVRMTKQTGKGS
jgi:hypothetical protein